ncbi:hypothetical protein ACN2MM_08430 [Alkalilimnicola ehrlichii MLHE-1]|uniref:hypothetical protein n=1 Tax=Alkalilimnicola ehrlichii TaxID=351052 RepID=UPI0012EAD7B9|nr:hypothetical protein [Alkalilimnicola ehrlichii]
MAKINSVILGVVVAVAVVACSSEDAARYVLDRAVKSEVERALSQAERAGLSGGDVRPEEIDFDDPEQVIKSLISIQDNLIRKNKELESENEVLKDNLDDVLDESDSRRSRLRDMLR